MTPPTGPGRSGLDRDEPRLSRRCLLRAAGVGGAALTGLPLVTSCSAARSGSGQPPTTTVRTSAVPVGGGVIEPATDVVVVQPTSGVFRAFSAICPHQGCTVDSITGGVIMCPCHGSTFRVSDGSVITGPAPQGLMALLSKVTDGEVVVTP